MLQPTLRVAQELGGRHGGHGVGALVAQGLAAAGHGGAAAGEAPRGAHVAAPRLQLRTEDRGAVLASEHRVRGAFFKTQAVFEGTEASGFLRAKRC